eukprot:TRINITY_DN112504_c0_g1_i1.p1 TRINITY_DN112504_c0_g1~~TRINITY_DN112504_c0_g1_i1.p1  ORF type:complete len:259 (+),score=69.77 TRINITY_DN112504_c0_g1_i1:61-837(+)
MRGSNSNVLRAFLACLAALISAASSAEDSKQKAQAASSIDNDRIQLGLAAAGGFLFVFVCAGCVKAVTALNESRRRRYASLPSDSPPEGQDIEEKERADILADVYGKPEDAEGGRPSSDDERALEKAMRAIEQQRDVSSDEDDLVHEAPSRNQLDDDDEVDFVTLTRRQQRESEARRIAPVEPIRPPGGQRNGPDIFDIGDDGDDIEASPDQEPAEAPGIFLSIGTPDGSPRGHPNGHQNGHSQSNGGAPSNTVEDLI